MTKIFLDTNIWLRFFLRDNEQYDEVKQLIEAIEEGRFLPYTSSIVFLELVYVLTKTYGLSRDAALDHVRAITETRNLTVIDKTDAKKALDYFSRYGIKFSDCLIASQIAKHMSVVSFDRELGKIGALTIKTPAQILNG